METLNKKNINWRYFNINLVDVQSLVVNTNIILYLISLCSNSSLFISSEPDSSLTTFKVNLYLHNFQLKSYYDGTDNFTGFY